MTTATRKSRKTTPAPKPKQPSKPKAPAVKAPLAEAAPQVTPTVVEAPQAVITGPVMRKKELVETVVTRSGMKKKDVKPVVEAMLAVLGEALGDNRELNLQPFGQVKVRKEKTLRNGRMVVAKIRQQTPPEPSKDTKDA